MSTRAATIHEKNELPRRMRFDADSAMLDLWLLGAVLCLLAFGLVMVASASVHIAERDFLQPWHYAMRQAVFIGMGLVAALVVMRVPVIVWQRLGPFLLLGGIAMLIAVLLPGIGKTVNGATRWINLGVFNLQVSELMKLFMIVYVAGYLVRRGEEVRASFGGFIKPLAVVGLVGLLLLAEPDFGAAVVIGLVVMGLMFIGGVRLWQFGGLLGIGLGLAAAIVFSSEYRMRRVNSFMDPWADQWDSGFQLTQALIAIGRGEIGGVGLGASVQKMFYLPEAHTDFLFSVIAEEFGLIGSAIVIFLFGLVVVRAFLIGRKAEVSGNPFAAYVAYGVGMWVGLQAFINLGVNMGVLPTKGLTLPLMSYGGSSVIVMCMALALVLRIDYELHRNARQAERRSGANDRRKKSVAREAKDERREVLA